MQESVQVSAGVLVWELVLASCLASICVLAWQPVLGISSGWLVLYKTENLGFVVEHVKRHIYDMESRAKPVSCLWILLRVQMCAVSPGHIRVCEVASKVSCRVQLSSQPQDCWKDSSWGMQEITCQLTYHQT